MNRAALVTALLLPSLAIAQDTRVAAAAQSIVAADLLRDATYLASDALRGRGTPSPGLDSAQAYVIRELTRLGIKPAGDDGTYLQHYTIAVNTLDTVATRATLGTRRLVQGTDFVVRTFLTPGTREGAIVWYGDGSSAPDARGKWLVATQRSLRGAFAHAASTGALGVLTVSTAALVPRAVTSRELEPSVGRAFAPSAMPQLTISSALLGTLGVDTTAAPGVLAGAPLRVDIAATTTRFQASNIVALVEGRDARAKDEWISVSSHLDGAVGRAPNAQGDSIFNAADDNASGSSGNLAIARALLRAPRTRRSILLVWDSGEETGLWGSRFLAYGPTADKLVAHFTVDMIARTRRPGTNVAGEEELSGPDTAFAAGPRTLSTQMSAVLDRVSHAYGGVTLDRRFDDPAHEFFYPRTDAAPYLERGIPYVEIFTGLHGDYHRQSDEVAKFDPAKFQAVARTIFAALWTLADDPVRPRIDKPLPASLSFITPR